MIRLGIIGTGGMAGNQVAAFRKLEGVALTACCDVNRARAEAFALQYGISAVYTDYQQMLDAEHLDAVSNVTPDALHAEVALAVLARGLPILSEKPLATTLDDARTMAQAAASAGVITMVNFSFRNNSALQKAAAMIRDGAIGRVKHVEASYLQSWLVSRAWGDWRDNTALTWRLSTRHGSAGVLGDLGCHLYDAVSLLCGDISTIDCALRTFDKGQADNRLGEYVLDANDSFAAIISFADGALGTAHSTRWATGHINSMRLRVFGDAGGIELDLAKSSTEFSLCAGPEDIESGAWHTVSCPPTPNNYQRFLHAIDSGEADASDFSNGLRIQAYLHYSARSAETGRPEQIIL